MNNRFLEYSIEYERSLPDVWDILYRDRHKIGTICREEDGELNVSLKDEEFLRACKHGSLVNYILEYLDWLREEEAKKNIPIAPEDERDCFDCKHFSDDPPITMSIGDEEYSLNKGPCSHCRHTVKYGEPFYDKTPILWEPKNKWFEEDIDD